MIHRRLIFMEFLSWDTRASVDSGNAGAVLRGGAKESCQRAVLETSRSAVFGELTPGAQSELFVSKSHDRFHSGCSSSRRVRSKQGDGEKQE
jgi:hypothetical protein